MAEASAKDSAPPTAVARTAPPLTHEVERKRPCDDAEADRPSRRARVQEQEEPSGPVAESADLESKGPPSVARLDEWCLAQGKTSSPYSAPETAPIVLCGRVYGHPRFVDGMLIWSSPIVWLDCGEERAALTRSRQYLLGDPEAGFLTFLAGRTDATSVALLSPVATTTRRCYPNGS
jgi:hypothetical protein